MLVLPFRGQKGVMVPLRVFSLEVCGWHGLVFMHAHTNRNWLLLSAFCRFCQTGLIQVSPMNFVSRVISPAKRKSYLITWVPVTCHARYVKETIHLVLSLT